MVTAGCQIRFLGDMSGAHPRPVERQIMLTGSHSAMQRGEDAIRERVDVIGMLGVDEPGALRLPERGGDAHKKEYGDWSCRKCSFVNFARRHTCHRCDEQRGERQ